MVPVRWERVVKQEGGRAPADKRVKTLRTRLEGAAAGVPARLKALAMAAEDEAADPAGEKETPHKVEPQQRVHSPWLEFAAGFASEFKMNRIFYGRCEALPYGRTFLACCKVLQSFQRA
jgi:hypothetical protein